MRQSSTVVVSAGVVGLFETPAFVAIACIGFAGSCPVKRMIQPYAESLLDQLNSAVSGSEAEAIFHQTPSITLSKLSGDTRISVQPVGGVGVLAGTAVDGNNGDQQVALGVIRRRIYRDLFIENNTLFPQGIHDDKSKVSQYLYPRRRPIRWSVA